MIDLHGQYLSGMRAKMLGQHSAAGADLHHGVCLRYAGALHQFFQQGIVIEKILAQIVLVAVSFLPAALGSFKGFLHRLYGFIPSSSICTVSRPNVSIRDCSALSNI